MRKPKFAGSWLCALLCIAGAVSPAKSEDQPRLALKNVSLVVYKLAAANKDRCAVDWEAWNTAINFVANQSTKLKLIRETEHYERQKELSDKLGESTRKFLAARSDAEGAAAKKTLDEATEKHSTYFAAPKLLLVAEKLEHNGSCFGTLSATVTAMLKPSEMIATGKLIPHPSEEIWSREKLLVGPPSSFSRFVIETSEEMMKSFVNDWTLSQELFSP
jgi:hypothetical protein